MNKSKLIKSLLTQGKSVKEVIKEVGCTPSLVYMVRGKKRKYTKRKVTKQVVDTPKVIPAKDNVNSPAHYTTGGIETYAFIKAKGLSYELGNVVKYVSRAKHKGNHLEDLKKARWYLDAAIKQEEER